MKTCIDCNTCKPFTDFVPKASCKDGYEPRCRKCRSIKYNKSTPALLCKKIYNTQLLNSMRREHAAPTYNLTELTLWVVTQPQFSSMFADWEATGYAINKTPSVDRVDDNVGYTLDNIQLLTWEDNRLKSATAKQASTLIVNHRAVVAFTKDGVLHKRYASMAEAMREFGGKASQSWGISSVCNGTQIKDGKGNLYTPKTYKGFIWKWE
jgi:predicted lactoylglutathione lyase